jgi:DNA polymerase-3 subunit alpha
LVASVRTQATDNGKRAFVQLDDKTAYYEALVFTDTFSQFGHLLEKESAVVLEGTLDTDQRTGKTRLRIEKILNMQGVREAYLRKITLRVDENLVQTGVLSDLRKCFKAGENAGCTIAVEYNSAQARAELRLDGQWRVPLDDTSLRGIRLVLGKENVALGF